MAARRRWFQPMVDALRPGPLDPGHEPAAGAGVRDRPDYGSAGSAPVPTPADPRVSDGPAAVRLRGLAEQGATGALEFTGTSTGMVYLVGGRVSHVHAASAPGLEQRTRARAGVRVDRLPPLTLQALLTDALTDAALALLGDPEAAHADTRFTAGQQHWTALSRPRPLPDVLGEVVRRQWVLAAIDDQAAPDEPVGRVAKLGVPQLRLTAAQWELVRLADGRSTPRTLAWTLGRGVFGTTVDVATLSRAGVLTAPGQAEGRDRATTAAPAFVSAAARMA